ncbi:MAG: NAD(P)-binding protein, partial [Beijerinckiaceae bacterium]
MSTVAVVGAGPAGLIAAERLAEAGHSITVSDA